MLGGDAENETPAREFPGRRQRPRAGVVGGGVADDPGVAAAAGNRAMLIYLDNCCLNRPFDDQSQPRIRIESEAKLEIQDKVRRGDLDLAWSYVLDLENEANPFENRQRAIAAWREVAKVDTEETAAILATANALRSRNVKVMDSLHLACAIALRCHTFFTTDDGILKKRSEISGIAVMSPVEYIAGIQT